MCNTGTVTFQPVLIKTLVNYYIVYIVLCASYSLFVQRSSLFVYSYSLFIYAHCSLLSFIYFVHRLTLYSFCCSILFFFDSFAFITRSALFKREKFNSDPALFSRHFDSAYNIIYASQ